MEKGLDYTGITVVYFCHDGQGNFIMSKRNENCRDEYGTWDPGGGGLEFGERIEDALRREIREEYCTTLISYEFLGFRDVHREHAGRKTHWIAIDYKVLVDRDLARNGEPHKHDEVRWFSLDSLPLPLHSQFPHFLSRYEARLRELPVPIHA